MQQKNDSSLVEKTSLLNTSNSNDLTVNEDGDVESILYNPELSFENSTSIIPKILPPNKRCKK